MIHSVNHKINLIYEYGRLKVKCSLINTWSVEGLATTQRSLIDVWSIEHDFFVNKMFDKNYKHNFHGLFWEWTAALNSQDNFSSDISEASDDSDKDKSYNPPVSGNNQSDTDLDSEYGKSC